MLVLFGLVEMVKGLSKVIFKILAVIALIGFVAAILLHLSSPVTIILLPIAPAIIRLVMYLFAKE